MFSGRRIAVVVPAFNEAAKIARTVRSIPGFVDHVIVIDDASTDGTGRTARRSQRRGLEVLSHDRNLGVGAAIATGYVRARALGAEVTAVMAGDSQMDPADLASLVGAVVSGRADYAKGNRFAWPGVCRVMPLHRLLGNFVLSHLTRLASGYTHLFDSQCGYTAANRRALDAIAAGPVFPRYGYPNDLLGPTGARASASRACWGRWACCSRAPAARAWVAAWCAGCGDPSLLPSCLRRDRRPLYLVPPWS